MNLVMIIAWREITTLLRRASFWIAALGGPLVAIAMLLGIGYVGRQFGDQTTPGQTNAGPATGFVDKAGVIRSIPTADRALVLPFQTEDEASAAMRAGRIGSFFIVAPDYMKSGQVTRVSPQVGILSDSAQDTRLFQAVLDTNLVGDAQLARRLTDTPDMQVHVVNPTNGTTTTQPSSPFSGISYGLALILAISIANGGGQLLQAVAEEKENRTIEILLTSAPSWKIMAGKLLGLSTVVLIQFLAWLVIARLLIGAQGLMQVDVGSVPVFLWLWVVIYYLLGFLLLGGLMLVLASVGASMRESGQFSGLMTIPVVAPLWFSASIVENPSGWLARGLSLFPLTAPVTMMLRLGQGAVAPWELAVSLGLLALSVLGAIVAAARLFRASTLLTGTKPTPVAIWRALRST